MLKKRLGSAENGSDILNDKLAKELTKFAIIDA